jgi:FimV-like protein
MIRKNILAIALLGVFGLSHAADVENLRTLSYLNEPLRLQADVIGEGEIILAAPTEYLRLNHPIPSYDLSVNIVEQNGQKQVVLTTTEEIESPALTLLLESRDKDNRRQLFELPIILDFKPEPSAEPAVAEATDSEIVIDGVAVDEPVATTATDKVTLAEVPTVAKEATKATPKVAEKLVVAAVKAEPEKAKVEVAKVEKEATTKAPAKAPAKALSKTSNTNPELLKRYPVEKGETLWSIANKVRPANVTPQKMIEIIKANNPSAFTAGGVLRADVTLLIPTETPKVKHNFVTSADANEKSDVRIGYIYELPEPPVQQVAEPAKTVEPEVVVVEDSSEVPVKVVRPVDNGTTTVTMNTDLLQDLTPENAQMAEELLAESQKRENNQVNTNVATPVEVVKPVETVTPVTEPTVEATKPEVVEPVKAVEPVKEEVAKPVEPPKKRPVYVMPEPEPEPGIVELIFENIVYIGAGALVLILGLLAVVMRRRKGGEPKQPKEKKTKVAKIAKTTEVAEEVEQTEKPKKKGLSLFGKKKDAVEEVKAPKAKKEKASKGLFGLGKKKADTASVENDVVEVQAVETVAPVAQPAEVKPAAKPQVAPVAAAIATAAVATAVAAPKAEVKDEATIESLDFDLSFTDDITPTTTTVVEEAGLDFDLSSLDLGTAIAEAEAPKVEETADALDFDLSSLDLGTSTAEVEVPKAEESAGGLDFDLSSLDLGTTPVEVEELKTEDAMGGLDFDLSSLDLGTTTAQVEETKAEEYGGLDFDLSAFSTPSAEAEVPKEESFDMGAALDFDLGDFKVEEAPVIETAVEEMVEIPTVSAVEEDSFGENNPLFAPQTGTVNAIEAIAEEAMSDSNEPEEYISFPDLLENAEDTLVKDDIEAEKPVDFGSFLEDEEAGLANLMEVSKQSEVEPKLDLAFVADADEDAASLAFLDSLDTTDEVMLDDPINSSVKDNAAQSVEAIDVPEPVEIELDTLELPTLDVPAAESVTIEEPVMAEIEVPEITLMEPMIEEPAIEVPEVTLVEPVIAEPVVEEITIPEVTLAEPMIEEVVIPEPVIETPITTPVAAVVETIEEGNDADFESEQVKLELAVAYMDFDKSLAKPLLDEVVKDGSPKQIERAQALLAQIN